jgi:hypothetical protein
MPLPNSDEGNRDYWPPPIWSAKEKETPAPPKDPPVVRQVTLPEKVSVGYLAEITGRELIKVVDELVRMRCFLGKYRSLDFEDAAKFLRKYGVGANREGQ